MTRNEAYKEARKRARLGYPHHVVAYNRHEGFCLYSSGHTVPAYPCTCEKPQTKKHYALVLA